jgi:hypothetical protein
MTKTTVITWNANQTSVSQEQLLPFSNACMAELDRLMDTGATTGPGSAIDLADGKREIKRNWADEESAQAWLDFVLATVQATYGPEYSYHSGVIEDLIT